MTLTASYAQTTILANQNHQTLRALDKAENRAWRRMVNGTEADACTIRGQEGKNYLAWCKAADACYAYREAHNIIGQDY